MVDVNKNKQEYQLENETVIYLGTRHILVGLLVHVYQIWHDVAVQLMVPIHATGTWYQVRAISMFFFF